MNSNTFNTPVLFLVFNRLETTKQVFEAIRIVKPKYFYIAADGPRATKENEEQVCDEVRNFVLNNIDWDCEIKTLFRTENLGCGKAVSQAITWFFENVEEGIILEDDCLPNSSFFSFCQELLEMYRGNEKVCHISGTNYQMGNKRGDSDYYFSNYPHIWGWATWSKAWKKYDVNMKGYETIKNAHPLKKLFPVHIMDGAFDKTIDTWDAQWLFTNILHEKISILPNKNLVTNIGFSENATHTTLNQIPEYITKSVN